MLRNFLNSKFSPRPVVQTVAREKKYIKLPYLGHMSFTIRKQLQIILRDFFPQIDFRFVFTNQFTIGSLLKQTKPKPFDLTSGVVYLFNCPCCNARYIGSTSRWLQHRIYEHKGVSIRTKLPISRPSHSAIREHFETESHPFTSNDFSILTSISNRADLVTLESLYITKMKPNLNNTTTAQHLFTQ